MREAARIEFAEQWNAERPMTAMESKISWLSSPACRMPSHGWFLHDELGRRVE